MVEVKKRVAEKVATCGSSKELLNSIKPYTSPDFHAALMDALASVEAEGESVSLDGASTGYKKFAEKVKVGKETCAMDMQAAVQSAEHHSSWIQLLKCCMVQEMRLIALCCTVLHW